MTRPAANRWRSGSVAIEVAILIVPLLVLIFGVIEYGRLQWTRNALQQTAIAGARCAGLMAVSCTSSGGSGARAYNASQTLAYVRAQAAGWYIGIENEGVIVTSNVACDGATNMARVEVNHVFRSPFLAPIQSATWPIRATACFPNQN